MDRKIIGNQMTWLVFAVTLLITGCDKRDEPESPDKASITETAVLLYAVASNNLYSNLISDKKEIVQGAKDVDLDKNAFYLYEVTPNANPRLLKLERVSPDSCTFVVVKDYTKELYSTDPIRIADVIEDFRDMQESMNYGLILWSHGTGFDPSFSTHGASDMERVAYPMLHSFGSDKDSSKDSKYSDETDIDELADAIPDGLFNFIWFDACYMCGIETVYELRDKCDYFIGYPTEVFTPGMPYHITVPYLMRRIPDLVGAAKEFFYYYADYPSANMRVATVAVLDVSKIEPVADYCRLAYNGMDAPSVSGLQKYTRGSVGPFYDFGQYTRQMAMNNPLSPSVDEFDSLLDDFVMYKAATDVDFNSNPIVANNFSGISCHVYDAGDVSAKGEYYRSLEWFKRVY